MWWRRVPKSARIGLMGTVVGGIAGVLCFGSIAAVTPGAWSVLESCVIGFWIGAPVGAFFAGMSQL